MMNDATIHHIKNNRHHPEFHTTQTDGILNVIDRDKPPQNIIDGSKMNEIDIAEMVADWLAVAKERGSSAKIWADKNINIRWKFTPKQVEQIYKIINHFEGNSIKS